MASKYLTQIENSIVLNGNKKGILEGLIFNETDSPEMEPDMQNGPSDPQINNQPKEEEFGDLDNINSVDDLDKEDNTELDPNKDISEQDPNIESNFDNIRQVALNGLSKLSNKKYVGTPEYETFKKIFLLIDKLNEDKQEEEVDIEK